MRKRSLEGPTQHRHGLPIHSNSPDLLMIAVLGTQSQTIPQVPEWQLNHKIVIISPIRKQLLKERQNIYSLEVITAITSTLIWNHMISSNLYNKLKTNLSSLIFHLFVSHHLVVMSLLIRIRWQHSPPFTQKRRIYLNTKSSVQPKHSITSLWSPSIFVDTSDKKFDTKLWDG